MSLSLLPSFGTRGREKAFLLLCSVFFLSPDFIPPFAKSLALKYGASKCSWAKSRALALTKYKKEASEAGPGDVDGGPSRVGNDRVGQGHLASRQLFRGHIAPECLYRSDIMRQNRGEPSQSPWDFFFN